MKKASMVMSLLAICSGMLLLSADRVEASKEVSKLNQGVRMERLQIKLEAIRQKAGQEVKERVAEKIQAVKVAEQQAAVEKAEQNRMEQAQMEQENQVVAEPVIPEQVESINPAPNLEAITGASQSGREIGERNREYGQQLSDPNLSQGERQAIIQEKKEYNRNR